MGKLDFKYWALISKRPSFVLKVSKTNFWPSLLEDFGTITVTLRKGRRDSACFLIKIPSRGFSLDGYQTVTKAQ